MRIIESRSIDNQAGLLGSRLITGTNAIEGAFQSFIVAEDTVVTKVYNSIGIDVTGRLGLTSITLKAGAFISMPKGDYFSSIKLASGSIVAYFTSHGGMSISADAYLSEFLSRTGSSYLEASECVKAHLQQLINIGLLQKASLIMSPSMYEEDLVKSVVPQDASGDLSFTRASNGTRINSAGLVEDVPWNLLTYSEEFNNASWTKTNSSITANTTTAPNGTTTADKIIENSVNGVHFTFNVGATLLVAQTLSVYAKADTRTQLALQLGASSVIYNLSNGTIVSGSGGAIENAGNGWYRCSITTTPTNTNALIFTANGGTNSYAGDGTSGLFIWGAQLNTGTLKPYFPTTDRLNVPRLTYQNGGGGCPSLLLEKQSTNLALYSEQFDNAAWTKTSGTVTANQAISPDGTQNADKCVVNNGVQVMDMRTASAFSITNGSVYTWSLYVKKAGYSYCQMTAWTGDDPVTVYDLDNGVVVSESGPSHTSTITSVGNGWYRITITRTATDSVAWLRFSPLASATPTDQNGTDGTFIWGAQVEASTYVTSYIPTTSSSATRVADACYKTGISSLIGQTEGTMFVQVTAKYKSADIASINTAATNAVYIVKTSNNYYRAVIYAGGVSVVAITQGTVIETSAKIAVVYKSGSTSLFINGSKIQTDTTTYTFTTALNSFYFQPNYLIGLETNEVQQSCLFPTALTDAECISLTTL